VTPGGPCCTPNTIASTADLSLLRKLMHVALAWLPVLGWWLGYPWAVGLALALMAASLVVEWARRRWHWVNRLLWTRLPRVFREWEDRRVLGSTWFALGALAALLLFGRDAGGTAVLFLAWGDPSAEFVGRRWGRRLSFGARRQTRKTVLGSAACLAACLAAGVAGVSLGGLSVWAVVAGAVVATLVERWSPPPDDNVWMPLLSGLVMLGLEGAFY